MLIVLGGIAIVRRLSRRPLISRVPALRSSHILMFLGTPSVMLFFIAIDAHGSLFHRLPIYILTALASAAAIASMVKGLSIYRQVRRAKGMACPRCLYELSWECNRCPECGRDYTPDEVRSAWRSENVPF